MIIMEPTSPGISVTGEKTKSIVDSRPLNGATSKTRRINDWWTWEVHGVVVSGVAIAGIAGLLHHFDQQPEPNWSYTYHGPGSLIKNKSAHISFNSVLSLLSTVARICLLIPITRGLAQLKWVWLAEKDRVLADLNDFDEASRQGLLNSLKLVWIVTHTGSTLRVHFTGALYGWSLRVVFTGPLYGCSLRMLLTGALFGRIIWSICF